MHIFANYLTNNVLLFDMDILLWEWNFDAVLVQCVVNGTQYITDDICLLSSVCPYEHLEIDAGITQLANYGTNLLGTVYPLVIQFVNSIINQRYYLLQITAISYTVRNNLQNISMIACQVLVVLGEQL